MGIERGLAAAIPQATQLPQDARADELPLEEHRGNLVRERGQLRIRARGPGVLRRVGGAYRRAHRVPRQPQLRGDAADAQPLGMQVTDRRPGFHADHPRFLLAAVTGVTGEDTAVPRMGQISDGNRVKIQT